MIGIAAAVSVALAAAAWASGGEGTTRPSVPGLTTQAFNTSGPVPIPLEPDALLADTPNPFNTPGDDERVDANDAAMLSAATESLDQFPPSVRVPPQRRQALMLLDAVFHDPYARQRKAVQAFHVARAERVVEQLERTPAPTDGAQILAFYNMGFVVRTRSVTIGFDLIGGEHMPGFTLSRALMDRLADRCDVLFISHVHWDHADPMLAQAFLDRGKPVVGPPDLWAEYPIHARLTPLNRDAGHQQTLLLKGGGRRLGVTIEPGFQQMKGGQPDVTNNVYLVRTPEDLCIGHTGDNNGFHPSGFEWIDDVHKHGVVDVLILNDWTQMVPRTLRGFDPRLVVAGHFEELGHDNVWARAPYWRGLVHGQKSPWPWLVMAWGERFDYHRTDFPAEAAKRPATP